MLIGFRSLSFENIFVILVRNVGVLS